MMKAQSQLKLGIANNSVKKRRKYAEKNHRKIDIGSQYFLCSSTKTTYVYFVYEAWIEAMILGNKVGLQKKSIQCDICGKNFENDSS